MYSIRSFSGCAAVHNPACNAHNTSLLLQNMIRLQAARVVSFQAAGSGRTVVRALCSSVSTMQILTDRMWQRELACAAQIGMCCTNWHMHCKLAQHTSCLPNSNQLSDTILLHLFLTYLIWLLLAMCYATSVCLAVVCILEAMQC